MRTSLPRNTKLPRKKKASKRRQNLFVSPSRHRRPSIPEDKKPLKRDGSGAAAKSSKHSEEPPAKKMKEEKEPAEEKKEEEEKTEEKKEETEKAEAPGGEQRSDEDSAKKETIPEGSQPAGSAEAVSHTWRIKKKKSSNFYPKGP